MPRSTWDELPAPVRAAIEHEAGPVLRAEIPPAGRNSDFSATLHLPDGRVFCKGIVEGRRGAMHRHEAEINPHLPSAIAPRLRWRTEVDGWLLLGFEWVPGHHADLAPGSPDLPLVAATMITLGRELPQAPENTASLAEQWARTAAWRRLAKGTADDLDDRVHGRLDQLMELESRAVESADGNRLVHTDLHPLNILVDGERARVVDWAWSRRGAPAVDVAFLIARLVVAGHSPEGAERWADRLPVWRDTGSATRDALAVAIWGIWEYLQRTQPLAHRAKLTAAARTWALQRLGL